MTADTIKLYAATLTAVVMAIGGCLLLVYVWMQPIEGQEGVMAMLGGFIGFAIQFLFGQETATRATRAAQSSAASGAVTATASPPITHADIDPVGDNG